MAGTTASSPTRHPSAASARGPTQTRASRPIRSSTCQTHSKRALAATRAALFARSETLTGVAQRAELGGVTGRFEGVAHCTNEHQVLGTKRVVPSRLRPIDSALRTDVCAAPRTEGL